MTKAANLAALAQGPAFSYYQSTQQTGIAASVSTKVNFQTAVFDTTGGMFANSRFTPTVAGYYLISATCQLPAAGATSSISTSIFKNGSEIANGTSGVGSSILWAVSNSTALIYLNGSTDYVEVYVYGTNNGSAFSLYNQIGRTYITGFLARAA